MWYQERMDKHRHAEILVLEDLIIRDFVDPIEVVATSTYPNLIQNYTNSNFLQCKAILASTVEIVDDINDYITNLLPGVSSLRFILFLKFRYKQYNILSLVCKLEYNTLININCITIF